MSESSLRLDVNDLEVRRGERRLIQGLRFTLDAGQKALIVGPNGSGKTSLLRVIAGIAPCASGSVMLNDYPVNRLPVEHGAAIAYRGHLDGLKKDLTVRENLEFHAVLHGGSVDIDATLDSLSLGGLGERLLRHLSAGQRRRVALAALRCGRAGLWILDEPMTNLDAAGRSLVARWVDAHLEQGGLAVVATHQPEELAASGTLLVEL